MVIESGIIIFVGLLLLFLKLKKKHRTALLKHSLALDISVAAIAYALHWGTFTGVMAAAVAGLMTSTFTALAQRWDNVNGSFVKFIFGDDVDVVISTQ